MVQVEDLVGTLEERVNDGEELGQFLLLPEFDEGAERLVGPWSSGAR
ncbi:MAG: hypothetical protein V3U47_04525 [Acidimicrobiia bacterium]